MSVNSSSGAPVRHIEHTYLAAIEATVVAHVVHRYRAAAATENVLRARTTTYSEWLVGRVVV